MWVADCAWFMIFGVATAWWLSCGDSVGLRLLLSGVWWFGLTCCGFVGVFCAGLLLSWVFWFYGLT